MSNFDLLERRRVAWCLVVNGLPYRYYSGVAPTDAGLSAGKLYSSSVTVVQTPTDVEAVVEVGPIRMTIDDLKPTGMQEPVEVRILARDARVYGGGRIDPEQTFGRVAGWQSAERAARLLTSLDHVPTYTSSVEVEVADDVTGWTMPAAIHIGQEVMWATGTDGDGNPGTPWKFTGVTRGADRHSTQAHDVDATAHEQPWVTSDVTTWRGRFARIYVSAMVDGVALDWRQYWAGFIDSAPEVDDDTITVRIAPLSAVMDYRLGVGSASRTATAVAGCHRFRTGIAGVADRVAAQVEWSAVLSLDVDSADVAAGTVTLSASSAAALDMLGRFTDGVTFSAYGEEEHGVWNSPDLEFTPVFSALVSAIDSRLTTWGVASIGTIAQLTDTIGLRLVDPDDAPDTIVEWPKALLDAVNVANAWQPGPYHSWADPAGAGGEDNMIRLTLRESARGWELAAIIPDNFHVGVQLAGAVSIMRGGRQCWAGFIAGESAEDVQRDTAAGGSRGIAGYALPVGDVTAREDGGDDPQSLSVVGPAEWFYQGGEPFIGPFDRDIYTGSGERQQVRFAGDGVDVTLPIVGSASGTNPATGATVYWLEVSPAYLPFARTIVQMPGAKPVTAQVVAGAANVAPPEYLLRLLASGIGNGDNGGNDLMPIGANLPSILIDSASFLSMPVPVPLRGQDFTAIRGKTIAEQTTGLMMACGCQVASVYNETGDYWRVSLVHIGVAESTSSVLTLTDSQLIAPGGRPPVRNRVDGRVVRSFAVKMNYPADGSDPVPIAVGGNSERNDAAGDSGNPLDLELPGVVIEGAGSSVQAALELVADIRARVGVPRMRWLLAIPADTPGALALGFGSVVTLTSEYARAVKPSEAVAAVPCRVVGMDRDLDANRLELELRPFGSIAAGWAPAMRVETVVDSDTVTVEADAFSDDDVSYFAANDAVSCVNVGDWSGRTARTISSIVSASRTVNFSAAHGLAVGDTIRHDDYDGAAGARAFVGGYAFTADSAGTIGTDAVAERAIG